MSFSLTAVFGVDSTGVKTELRQLRREFGSFVSDSAKLGAGVAVGAFVALSKGALDLASQLKDSALQIGINVEALQALHYAATQNGSSVESMNKALAKLRTTTREAFDGNEQYSAALKVLGLNAAELLRLPLEQQYIRVAQGARNAADKTAAYNAVAALFGSVGGIGHDQISVLNALATEGWPKVAKAAADAGQVMSAQTIVALENASQAIDNFKKRATIAVGNILVNFRSEEGLKLMLYQFLRIAGTFGARIIDALADAGGMIKAIFWGELSWVVNKFRDGFLDSVAFVAKGLNKILPDRFQINIDGIESLKSAGKDLGDTIVEAIANTRPSTFAKDVTDYWDKAVSDQQKVVDQLNNTQLGPDAHKLTEAGKSITNSAAELRDGGEKAAKAIEDAVAKAKQAFKEAGESLYSSTKLIFDRAAKVLQPLGAMNGSTLAQYSDDTLKEIVRQDTNKKSGLRAGTAFAYGDDMEIARLTQEILNAQRELDLRNNFRADIAGPGGIAAARDRYDPVVFEKLLQQFGPGADAPLNKIVTQNQKLLEQFRRGIKTYPVNTPSAPGGD